MVTEPRRWRIKVPAFEMEIEQVDATWPGVPPVEPPPAPTPPKTPEWPSELVLDEQFDTIDPTRWKVEHSGYGGVTASGNRLQWFHRNNVEIVNASPGGNGRSLRLTARREKFDYGKGVAEFTAGMISTRDAGRYYPRYGRYQFRARVPHGQGVWPALWLRHKGGSSLCEPDVMEYFHAQNGPMVSSALHRTDEAGKFATNVLGGRAFLEPPTSDMSKVGWHTFAMDILPYDPGAPDGIGDPTKPSSSVRFRSTVDDRVIMDKVDTSAGKWTAHSDREAFDICMQGSQIGGDWAGHPDDPLGWSRWRGKCLSSSGTTPDSCRTDMPDGPIIRAQFPNFMEVDYVRVWRLV